MARALAISSHVVRGHVGLAATVPALQHLGHEVWAVPTVLLASRPGLGRLTRFELPVQDLTAVLDALEADGCWPSIDAVFTGYFPSEASVAVVAQAIARIKAANPSVLVFVDPILGDDGRLYVAQQTAEAIRSALIPLATIATPNLFELHWLTRSAPQTLDEIARAARGLGPPTVVVTSAAQTQDKIATILVQGTVRVDRNCPRHARIPNGAGDLFAGLLLGALLNRQSLEAALDASLADLDRVLAASEGQDVLQLSALKARGT
jgi:pyridoxine kinase